MTLFLANGLDAPEPRVVTVGEFTRRLQEVFRRVKVFGNIGVSGEISNWRPAASGTSFRLSEGSQILECFAFQSVARTLPALANGMEVIAYGNVSVYAQRGVYQLQVESIVPSGLGALYLQQQKLRERFEREGLFDPRRKRPIPRFVFAVALVSARGQGAEDFVDSLRKSASHVRVEFVETRVQGAGAEVDIADAIDRASRLNVDAIALVRGGGAFEDRFAFNCEPVVRAILRARHPVITGIGHTADHHHADDVADHDGVTPSRAAEFIVSRWSAGADKLAGLQNALRREARMAVSRAAQKLAGVAGDADARMRESLQRRARRLGALQSGLDRESPQRRLHARALQLQGLRQKLDVLPVALRARADAVRARRRDLAQCFAAAVGRKTLAFAGFDGKLAARDPSLPLELGYAIIVQNDRVVRDAAMLTPGDAFSARMRRGTVAARVESVTAHE